MLNPVAVAFAAGSAGGLATVFTFWVFVLLGITGSFGVELPPPVLGDLYRMVVWGGIFGFLFLLPVMRGSIALRGVLFGLAPSAVQCFIVFPYALGAGMLGMGLGELTSGVRTYLQHGVGSGDGVSVRARRRRHGCGQITRRVIGLPCHARVNACV